MHIQHECLPCLISQVIKVIKIYPVKDEEKLFHEIFQYLSTITFDMKNPEIIGQTFAILKQHIKCEDPYYEVKHFYNQLFLEKQDDYERQILSANEPFYQAIRYAILGNIIDFNPAHTIGYEQIQETLDRTDRLIIDDHEKLFEELKQVSRLLYIGDNCGEIVFDKLLIKQIQIINPNIKIWYGVRGSAVVNDVTLVDAYQVGMDQYATVISNGDVSLGTVLHRVSPAFYDVYKNADLIISKGQANYESLSDEAHNIYFLLMAKCTVIAQHIQVPIHSLVCFKK